MIEIGYADTQEGMPTIGNSVIEELVKSNSALIDMIDKDPKLKEQYEKDMADQEKVNLASEKLTGLLYESLLLTTQEDQDYKWVDINNQRNIPYRYLRRAGETEGPLMIKNLRRLQLTEYAEPAAAKKYGRETGFALAWKNPSFEPNEEQKKLLQEWETRLQGKLFFPAGSTTPSFAKFLGQMYNDFFDVDDITIRIDRDRLNNPIGLQLEDPSLWFPTIPKMKRYPLPRVDDDILQYLNEKRDIEIPEAKYILQRGDERWLAVNEDRLIKSHFFLRTEYNRWLRGYSVMEQAVRVTTILINAFTYNASTFSMNRTPMGVLGLMGGVSNPLLMEKLKKVLWATMSGATNQRRLPLIGVPQGGDLKWVPIHNTPKELEFYTGMTLFMSVLCALSGTNPNELGMASFHDAMKGNRLNEANEDGIWKMSKDNGLLTFLNHAENTLNTPTTSGTNVFEEITKLPVKGTFRGLAGEDLQLKTKLNKERLTVDTSINQIRKENGEEAAELMIGEHNIYDLVAPDNQLVQKVISQAMQAEQQQKQAEMQQQAQQQNTNQDDGQQKQNLSERDQELIAQYGEPEGKK